MNATDRTMDPGSLLSPPSSWKVPGFLFLVPILQLLQRPHPLMMGLLATGARGRTQVQAGNPGLLPAQLLLEGTLSG